MKIRKMPKKKQAKGTAKAVDYDYPKCGDIFHWPDHKVEKWGICIGQGKRDELIIVPLDTMAIARRMRERAGLPRFTEKP